MAKELLPIKPPHKPRKGMFQAKYKGKARMCQGYENVQLNKVSKARLLKIKLKYPIAYNMNY